MSTYVTKLLGTALSDTSRVKQGNDNQSQTWTVGNDFIYSVAIGQDGRNTLAGAYKLQWRSGETNYVDLGATGGMKYTTNTALSNGTTVTSGEQKINVTTMLFQNGEEIEDGVSASIDLGSDYWTELQFGISPADALPAVYSFQLYNNTAGATLQVETGSYLTITVNKIISPNECTHAHAADAADAKVVHTFTPAECTHAHSAEQPVLAQTRIHSPAQTGHAHSSKKDATGETLWGPNTLDDISSGGPAQFRMLVPSGELAVPGFTVGYVRCRFQTGQMNLINVFEGASIGKRDGATGSYVSGEFVRLTFNNGQNTITVLGDEKTFWSDYVAFEIDPNSDYLVHIAKSGSSTLNVGSDPPFPGNYYHFDFDSDYTMVAAPGMSWGAEENHGLKEIQVLGSDLPVWTADPAELIQTHILSPNECTHAHAADAATATEITPTTYTTDFTEYTVDAQPSDWTERWNTGNFSCNVRDDGAFSSAYPIGSKYLDFVMTSASRGALSWDDVGSSEKDVEVLVKWVGDVGTAGDYQRRIYVRGSGSAGSENAYLLEIGTLSDAGSLTVGKYVSGTGSTIVTGYADVSVGAAVWTRFRVNGTSLKAKVWPVKCAEPDHWNIETTDSDVSTAGWVGVGAVSTNTLYVDYFAVTTNGSALTPSFPPENFFTYPDRPEWAGNIIGVSTVAGFSGVVAHFLIVPSELDGKYINGISFLPNTVPGSGGMRLAVYSGGSESSPAGATLLGDFGIKNASDCTADAWATISGEAYGPVSEGDRIWAVMKTNDGTWTVYRNDGTYGGGSYDEQGRWLSGAVSSDETVAYAETWPSDGTGSFSTTFYNLWLVFGEEGETEVEPNEATHAHSADAAVLKQTHTIAPAECTHAHSADAAVLKQTHILAPAETTHAHSVDAPKVSQKVEYISRETINSNSTGDHAITVPSDCDLILVSYSGYNSGSDALISAAIGAATFTEACEQVGVGGNYGMVGQAYLANPPTGSQTLTLSFVDDHDSHEITVSYWKNVYSVSPIRSSGITLGSAPYDTYKTLTSAEMIAYANEIGVTVVFDDTTNPVGGASADEGGQTEIAFVTNTRSSAVGYKLVTSDGTTTMQGAGNYPALASVVLAWVGYGPTKRISPNEATHAHSADAATALVTTTIIPAECSHAHAVDIATVRQTHRIISAECSHAHSTDQAVLKQTHILVPAECSHAHSVDQAPLKQTHVLSPAECTHSPVVAWWGDCDSSGNPLGSDTDWSQNVFWFKSYTCPGSGEKRVVQLSAMYNSGGATGATIQLGVYDSEGNLVAQGQVCELLNSSEDSWQGGAIDCFLVGGQTYYLALAINGTQIWSDHVDSGNSGSYKLANYVGSLPSSLPDADGTTSMRPIRCEVGASASFKQSHIIAPSETVHAHIADAPVLVVTGTNEFSPAECSQAHSTDQAVLKQTHILAPAECSHSHTVDAATVRQTHILVPAECAHAHVTDVAVLKQSNVLVPAECVHGHSADVAVLGQTHRISPAETLHAQAVDQAVLGQQVTAVPVETGHAHAVDVAVLKQTHLLSPAETVHAHLLDVATLKQTHIFVPAECSHAHFADAPNLGYQVTAAPLDGLHAHSVDVAVLKQTHILIPAECSHAHTVDAATLIQTHRLSPLETAHAHSAEQPTYIVTNVIVSQEALHAHAAEQPVLGQTHRFAPSETVHAHTAEAPNLGQQSVAVPDQTTHAHTVDAATVIQTVVVAPAETSHAHSVDSPILVQVQILGPAETRHGHVIDSAILVQLHIIVPSETTHAQSVESTFAVAAIEPDGSTHSHSTEISLLEQTHILAALEASHSHLVDIAVLLQTQLFDPLETIHSHTVDSPRWYSEHYYPGRWGIVEIAVEVSHGDIPVELSGGGIIVELTDEINIDILLP